MRWIGIDLGEKRVGLAVSDPGGSIAFPHSVTPRATIIETLQKMMTEYSDCQGFVLGMPKTLRGEEGRASVLTHQFAQELEAAFGKSVVLWDERLSTRAVLPVSRDKNRVDALAAQFILQGYIDSVKSSGTEEE